MSTKEEPGPFDCWDKLLPGEEYFLIRAKDPDFELFVRQWALNRRMQVNMGSRADTHRENQRIASALDCAYNGKQWRDKYLATQEVAKYGTNNDGTMAAGPHKRESTGTSGAPTVAREMAPIEELSAIALSPAEALANVGLDINAPRYKPAEHDMTAQLVGKPTPIKKKKKRKGAK